MARSRNLVSICGAGIALCAASSAAFADGYEYDGKALAAPKPAREFSYSFTLGATSDYVFRGFSQTDREPTLQGSVDLGYGIFYLGAWGSGLDFGTNAAGLDVVDKEIDLYGGITPKWKSPFGEVAFDLGFIYYWYPNARDAGAEFDYVEFKGGYSVSLIKNLTLGSTVYYSPEYTGAAGKVWTIETSGSYDLGTHGPFSTSISGLYGWSIGESSNVNYVTVIGNGDDEYNYWNAGLTLAVDKISFDFRYWDTDISSAGGFCNGPLFQCDETFVGSVSITLP